MTYLPCSKYWSQLRHWLWSHIDLSWIPGSFTSCVALDKQFSLLLNFVISEIDTIIHTHTHIHISQWLARQVIFRTSLKIEFSIVILYYHSGHSEILIKSKFWVYWTSSLIGNGLPKADLQKPRLIRITGGAASQCSLTSVFQVSRLFFMLFLIWIKCFIPVPCHLFIMSLAAILKKPSPVSPQGLVQVTASVELYSTLRGYHFPLEPPHMVIWYHFPFMFISFYFAFDYFDRRTFGILSGKCLISQGFIFL